MKNRKIYSISIILTLLLLVSCSNKTSGGEVKLDEESLENVNKESMPIVKEPIKLNVFANKDPATNDDWNDVLILNKYEEMTNIDVNWDMISGESLEEKRNLTLASGNLPDAFYGTSMPAADILKYGQQGVFLPLNDLIEAYAPNFKELLENNPDIKKALTFPDGNIYSFPTITDPDFLAHRLGPKPRINEEWLDALGMTMPETTEDFYEYLKAVKEKDPNGNGKADEIPYGGPKIDELYTYLLGSFGLANQGSSNPNIDMDPGTKELRFYPMTDGYKQLLEYLNKLYSEKLIAGNIFSIDHEQFLANASEGKYGSTVWYNPSSIFGKEGEELTGMPALEGPNGDKEYTNINPPVNILGSFLITEENENPAATVRWIDYFYGDEGMELFFMGIEGETFEKTDNGEYEFLDKIKNSSEGLTLEQEAKKYLTWPGGGYASIADPKFFKGPANLPDDLEAAKVLEPDIVKDPWSPFIYTKEENDKLAGIGSDIDKYVTEMRDKFISGDVSFDEWDKYVETIENMKLKDYMDIKTKAYKRYKDN